MATTTMNRAAMAAIAIAVAAYCAPGSASAEEPGLATPWASEHATKARLVAGGVPLAQQAPRLIAGAEIEMDEGWKTYWRNPGSSGVPPRFDFAGSENLGEANVLYPAPYRIPDREGDIIGYKKAVLFPIEITAKDPKLPVTLKLALEYGVCKDVCVPVQPILELVLQPDAATKAAGSVAIAALGRVPREAKARRPLDPELKGVVVEMQGDKPHILIDAVFPGDDKTTDVFLEAPDGIWIPLAKPMEPRDGVQRFHVDLTDGADIADLKGRIIRVTLVGSGGATDASFKFE